MDSYTSRPSSCSHHHRRGIDLLLRSPSWHPQNIGRFTTYIAIVARRVLMSRARPSSRGVSNSLTNLCGVCVSAPSGMRRGYGTLPAVPAWSRFVIGHGIGGKYIPIMARLAEARRWSKRRQTCPSSPDLTAIHNE